MSASFRIRRAVPADAAVIAEYNRRLAWETEALALDEATVLAGVAAVLGDPAKGVYFVADAGGQVVGQCSVTYEWSDWRNGNMWWFQSVYVEAGWRGRGVFRALYEAVEAEARREGVVMLRLYVESENARAQEAYCRRGMHRTHYLVYEQPVRRDG